MYRPNCATTKPLLDVLSMPSGIQAFKFLSKQLQQNINLAILAIQKSGDEYGTSLAR